MTAHYRELVERTLDEVLPAEGERPSVLSEAMRYAVGSGGKRIRPVLCLAAAEAVGGLAEDAVYPAAAIELLHNYTLVHDDLPAMDNDVERRGRATVWKKFGEANAILVGDALQALAFRTAARAPRAVAAIVGILAAKGVGVVAGQVEDLVRAPGATDYIYLHKTADLFVAAAAMGAMAGGGTPAEVAALSEYAQALGMAFQYADDLLDGDAPCDRATAERLVREQTAVAVAALDALTGDTAYLRTLAEKLAVRTY